jgi:outer membrane murein-binding lipoprotein Lpp
MSKSKAINPIIKYSIAAIALAALITPVCQATFKKSEGSKALEEMAAKSEQIQQQMQSAQKEIFPVRSDEMCADYQNKTKEEVLAFRKAQTASTLDPEKIQRLVDKGGNPDTLFKLDDLLSKKFDYCIGYSETFW